MDQRTCHGVGCGMVEDLALRWIEFHDDVLHRKAVVMELHLR